MSNFFKWGSVFLWTAAVFIGLLYWTIGAERLSTMLYLFLMVVCILAGGWIARTLIRDGAMMSQGNDHRAIGQVASIVAKDVAQIYKNLPQRETIASPEVIGGMLPEHGVLDLPSWDVDGLDPDANYIDID